MNKEYSTRHEKFINFILSVATKEEIEEVYFTHSKPETCEYFKLTNSQLSFLIKYYNIKKPKSAIKQQREITNLEKYGTKVSSQADEVKMKQAETCLEKYGTKSNLCTDAFKEQAKATCLKKYGTEFATQNDLVKAKIQQTKIENFGSISNCYEQVVTKGKATRIKNSGSLQNSYQMGLKNQSKVILEKYGVPYFCMSNKARKFTNNSKPNIKFAELLESYGFIFSNEPVSDLDKYSREFNLDKNSYDFKVGTTLLEVNPAATHNSTWGIFGDKTKLDKNYHINKSNLALQNNFRCIHIFDWDDQNKIINLILPKQKIYARKCIIKIVSESDTDVFLNTYHLQNTCKHQEVRLGLYYNDELVMLMTFGKPRYNKNYNFELLRLCTKHGIEVVGGASKLFTYFKKLYNSASIISYCDYSKFTGNIYKQLGFYLYKNPSPSKHWYNINTGQHITDNLLRQRGFDQLFGTHYGKGTSNAELMLNNNFVEIYDCGQATYIYK